MSQLLSAAFRWLDRNILELGRELRLSYLPPLSGVESTPEPCAERPPPGRPARMRDGEGT